MHSSTSSSSERVPRKCGWGMIIGSLVAFLAMVSTYEFLARSQGFKPVARDSKAHWCNWRQQVEPDSLVFLGDSRMPAGIDLEVFQSKLPDRRVIQLGIPATKPLAMLEHMLSDEEFKGTIICSFSAESYHPALVASQKPWVDFYEKRWTISEKFSYMVKSRLDATMVSRSSAWGITSMISTLIKKRSLPEPAHRSILFDRSRILDFFPC